MKIQTLTDEIARLKARTIVASPQATSPIRTIAVVPQTTTVAVQPSSNNTRQVYIDSPRRSSYTQKIDDPRYS